MVRCARCARPHAPDTESVHGGNRVAGNRTDADHNRGRGPPHSGVDADGGLIDPSRKSVAASGARGRGRSNQRGPARPGVFARIAVAHVPGEDFAGDPRATAAVVAATLLGVGFESSRYVLEIVTERGDFLSVPNEAILETGGKQSVYVQSRRGRYAPREIRVGVAGRAVHPGAGGAQAWRAGRHHRELLHRRGTQAEGLLDRRRMIAAIIQRVIRFRWLVWGCVGGARRPEPGTRSEPQRSTPSPTSPIPRSSSTSSGPAVRCSRDGGHRADHPGIGRIAGDPVDPRHVAYGLLVHLRHLEQSREPHGSAAVRGRPAERDSSAVAGRCVVTIGPNASSMGWIFQYALLDREGSHDLRELRLLNESQVKPALQAAAGVAEVASVGGLEKQYQVKLFPPLLS